MTESNSWEYLQKISAMKNPTRSSRTWCVHQISRTCSSRRSCSWASSGWPAISQLSRSMDVDTQLRPPYLCICGWVVGWFDLVNPSDILTWHRLEPWTNWALYHWSRLQLTSCSNLIDKCPLIQIYTIRNWKQ